MSSDHWQQAYEAGDDSKSWTQGSAEPSLAAIARTGVMLDGPIIDVGGGSSPLAGELLAAGHTDVTVLDIAENALDLARTRLGERGDTVHWLQADLMAWRPERQYAIWHDRAVLHFFTSSEDRSRYAQAVDAAVAPGGYAIVATFAPDGPEQCSGLPVYRSAPEETLALLGPAFSAVSVERQVHATPGGNEQAFSWLVARKA